MSKLEVKIKKVLKNAVIPEYQTNGAACFDLVAATHKTVPGATGLLDVYDTGLAFEIPEGHVGLIYPRSSVTSKTTLTLGNSVGVIDSDYRGTVSFQFRQANPKVRREYKVGDRVGQMMIIPIPSVQLVEVGELSDTLRGDGGYGSTGK
jgi:dUTP pyrophosphatase